MSTMQRRLRTVLPFALWPILIRLRSRLVRVRTYRFEIPINACVHYSGFRFGHGDYNPIECYLRDVYHQRPIVQARRLFIQFLLHYRPRHMGEAIGVEGMTRCYPMWRYPWDVIDLRPPDEAWCESPQACPDILTHFSALGILSYRIDEEFLWGERVLHSIAAHGYKPNDFRRTSTAPFEPIRTFELRKCDGRSAYLLLDGNHRVGALSALGQTTVFVEQADTDVAYEADCEYWYGVRSGMYSKADALRVFNAYFEGNYRYRICDQPAHIMGPSGWTQMYL